MRQRVAPIALIAAFSLSMPAAFAQVRATNPATLPAQTASVSDKNAALMEAVKKNDLDAVKGLLALGAKADAETDGFPVITVAADRGNPHIVKLLLDAGANAAAAVQSADENQGFQSLHVVGNNIEVAKMLLAAGAPFDARMKDGSQPIHYAAERGGPEMVKLLLSVGAKADVQRTNGETPLLKAVTSDYVESVKVLLAAGASPNIGLKVEPKYSGDTDHVAIIAIAAKSGNAEMVRLLLAAGARPDGLGQYGRMPIHLAAKAGSSETVQLLLAAGVSANTPTKGGFALPIHEAENVDTLKVLLAAGAKVDAVDSQKDQAIHLAAGVGKTGMVGLLLAAGAKADAKNGKGHQPLHRAAWNKYIDKKDFAEVFNQLTAAGAKIDAVDGDGSTALELAALGGATGAVEILMAATGPGTLKATYLSLLVQFAMINGHADTIKLLLAKGAQVDYADEDGNQLIHSAAMQGEPKLISALLAAGAKIDAVDTLFGRQPLHFAAQKGNLDVVKALIAAGAKATTKDRAGLTPAALAERGKHTAVAALLAQQAK